MKSFFEYNIDDFKLYTKQLCKEKARKIHFYERQKMIDFYGIFDSEKKFKEQVIDNFKQGTIKHKVSNTSFSKSYIENLAKISNNTQLYAQTAEAVLNTFRYIFYNHKIGIYVQIRDNKLTYFNFIENYNYRHPYKKYLKIDPKFNNEVTQDVLDKAKITGCLVKFSHYGESELQYMTFYYHEYYYFLRRLCEKRKVSDVDFFLNFRDQHLLKGDLTIPFHNIVNSRSIPLETHKYNIYCPIVSFSSKRGFIDLPTMTPDDIRYMYKQYFAPICDNVYADNRLVFRNWNDKKATAMFRGTSTGCSFDINKNPRLLITKINKEWHFDRKTNKLNNIDGVPYLNAGIISFSGRFKKEYGRDFITKMGRPNLRRMPFMKLKEQSRYKYQLYIEGNSLGYRLAFLFSLGSVVLYVKSPFKSWFHNLLVDRENCVFIERDFSNLYDVITWLKKNDNEAKRIAKNGLKLYNEHLNGEHLFDYKKILIDFIANTY